MEELNFKTLGEAKLYCEKFNAAKLVKPLDVFELAEALKRAYDTGLAENDWQPIETAPKDGSLVDLWCMPPADVDFESKGIRLPSSIWYDADDIFSYTGWVRVCDDGNYDLVEGPPCEWLCGLPPWTPVLWKPITCPK